MSYICTKNDRNNVKIERKLNLVAIFANFAQFAATLSMNEHFLSLVRTAFVTAAVDAVRFAEFMFGCFFFVLDDVRLKEKNLILYLALINLFFDIPNEFNIVVVV